ncbi:monooxygenase FAD-binding protein [Burkholderia lata]|uniref:Monooxygenase FAD-binding protein n=1 Tax=Burkholderia lata (strain ATCC 17760 / DSM 23089 / LMG 22485 / NCIMB 9086 / R18194 / 383) TaxID=482957 RepID=A0A6P2S4T8_BURL3|nr:FAD-dependent monooxygenase [Burkholderia lata]VWC37794.1 monooxygenase FAD-binding protein [Burkholderia lata]
MPIPVATTPVLIAGGGLVGLSVALFLQRLDVPFILVERNAGVSQLPRARGIHLRTMELFRQAGVEDAVKDAAAGAWVQGAFGGARRGRTLVDAEPVIDIAAMRSKMAAIAASPSSFTACPQTLIEPVLRRHVESSGGDVRFGHELVSFAETGDAVIANVRGPGGKETVIEAAWLVGADGGGSFVRRQLGIGTTDTPALQHFVNIFFHADLGRTVQGRTFSQCEIANTTVRGLFLAMDNADRWSFHLEYDPAQGPPADHALPGLVRAAIGLEHVEIDIQSCGTWNTGVRVATRYRSGRAFLCGDAAHLMPPWGGFNATTGIADAHNLAWKLAETLRGEADASLLDSYEIERRPLAVRNGHQALLRTDFDARFGIETDTNRDIFAGLLDTGDVLLRHRYPDAGAPSRDAPPDSVAQLLAQTGTRFPHAWIRRDGRQVSTLDLFGSGYVVLAGPNATVASSSRASLNRTTPAVLVAGRDFNFVEAETGWHALTALPDEGHVLVRPDGFVLCRSDEPLRD